MLEDCVKGEAEVLVTTKDKRLPRQGYITSDRGL